MSEQPPRNFEEDGAAHDGNAEPPAKGESTADHAIETTQQEPDGEEEDDSEPNAKRPRLEEAAVGQEQSLDDEAVLALAAHNESESAESYAPGHVSTSSK